MYILLCAGALCGLLTTWNSFFMGTANLMMALARTHMLPFALSKRSAKTGTPVNALIVCLVASIVGPFLGLGLIDPLTTFSAAAYVVSWGLAAFCLIKLRKTEPNLPRPYKIPGGLPGVETRGTLLFTYGVAAGRITAERMADVLAETPAKLYGLFPRKSVLQPGADADIVVYDPRGTSCITAADQAANVDYAPYEGTQIAGHIAEVYLRGTCVVREGKILHDRNGQYLHRGKCML